MKMYKHKPTIIQAYQWAGYQEQQEEDQVIRYFRDYPKRILAKCSLCSIVMGHHGQIMTQEEKIIVCPKDYIVTGINGELYPVKPSLFNELYEQVIDENKDLLERLEDNGASAPKEGTHGEEAKS